ncbi:MAG: acyl-CoA dehydrogenase [Chloroflexota bacterium]|nr:MAG: acyl-CoA dehydrogenase [Chloroflexota bacterium]
MDFRFPDDVERFRLEVREFLAREWHPDPAWGDTPADADRTFKRKLATKGWYALSIPKEYGGLGLPLLQQFVFHEELSYVDAPGTGVGVAIVAPCLIKYGTEEIRRRFIPRIISAEIDFCLGYSEPEAGSDLAALSTTAILDGDNFVINGQKMFTTSAHRTEFVWLAARTDPTAVKHKGISMLLVDIKSPGITIRPLHAMDDTRTNVVYYDNVIVPKENLVGEINRGWYYITTALDFERLLAFPIAGVRGIFDQIVAYVKQTSRGGQPLKDQPEIRSKLARLSADLEMGQLISHQAAWKASEGQLLSHEAAMIKTWSSELLQRTCHIGTQILGLYGTLQYGSKYAPLQGRIERAHRAAVMRTFGAGSNEIQRNIIALRGLGLAR